MEDPMSLKHLIAIAVAASGAAPALAAHAPAASTPVTLRGTVGPGFTINLTLAGRKVTHLKRGVRYRLVVADRSSIHNFHLTGPGLDRVITTVGFTGTKNLVFTARRGSYRYVCDPHSALMHGGFGVV
jgi:plastocyanin